MTPADIARPAHLYSAGKVIVSAAFVAAFLTLRNRFMFLYAGFIFLPAAALAVTRHLHAMTLRPYLRLGDAGLSVCTWEISFLVPWVSVTKHEIPWADLTGCTVSTFTVNGVATSSLVMQWRGGGVTIEPYVFNESAETLQQRILDAHAVRTAAPVPAAARPRATPTRTIRATSSPRPAMISFAIAAALIVILPQVTGDMIWAVWAGAPAIAVILGLVLLSNWTSQSRTRVIQLRPEGLAIGATTGGPLVAAWADIVFVRPRVLQTNGKQLTTGLRIGLRNGRAVEISGPYDVSYEELAQLLDNSRT